MQVFFFIEQKMFAETHTTFVRIFLPKCQNRKRLLETKAPGIGFALKGVCISSAFSFLEPDCFVKSLTVGSRGARSQALDQLRRSDGSC